MHIVHQSAPASYCLLPKYPLLPAPPTYLALPAPKVAGLLAAPKLTIVVEHYDAMDEFYEKYGPFKSIEELDAELYAEMQSPLTRAFYDELVAQRKARWADEDDAIWDRGLKL